MEAQVMAGVAGAVAAAVDVRNEESEEDMSDSAPFAFGPGEHGSDTEEEQVQNSDYVPPPPSADGGSAQKSVDDRVRDLWLKWMGDHKIKNMGTDPDTTHFAPWAEVGDIQNPRPREGFRAQEGMKRRMRPERGNHDPVTELECFEEMFTPEMQDRVIRCTNDKVARIQNGSYPKPTRATIWPPKWVNDWEILTREKFMLFIAVHVARSVAGVHESYVWETCKLTATPGIARILPRDKYKMIKAALSFQDENEGGGFQGLTKIGQLMDMFRNRCETRYQPGRWLSLDEMMVRFTGTTKYKFTREHHICGMTPAQRCSCPRHTTMKSAMLCAAKQANLVELRFQHRRRPQITMHSCVAVTWLIRSGHKAA
jgi:hypothetical protein